MREHVLSPCPLHPPIDIIGRLPREIQQGEMPAVLHSRPFPPAPPMPPRTHHDCFLSLPMERASRLGLIVSDGNYRMCAFCLRRCLLSRQFVSKQEILNKHLSSGKQTNAQWAARSCKQWQMGRRDEYDGTITKHLFIGVV